MADIHGNPKLPKGPPMTASLSSPIRVLIAEDEPHIRGTIKAIVETLGGQVVAQAADGEAAIERFLEMRPDIVILDIDMPKLMGDKVLARLMAIDPGMRAIMMTAQDTIDSVRRCMELGARDYILKSNPAGEIFRRLGDALFECQYEVPEKVAA
jgi:DNA-binding NarL/FixJ family response regulator